MKKAVVLLSGGVDSSTTLAIAKSQGFECYSISFQYGQRNHFELEMAKRQCELQGVKEHKIFNIDIGQFKGSALTDHTLDIPEKASTDVPITYVPARNTIFLSIALGWTEVLSAHDIFIGANIVDYSNYPDCRPEYIRAFQSMANLATRSGIEGNLLTIHTPLIQLSKSQIIQRGHELGVDYGATLSCYNPDNHGNPCKVCDSCRFRAKGFTEATIPDPALTNDKPIIKTLDIAQEDLEELKKILQYCVPQYTVWAFGSRVTGKARKFSDLDLIVITDKPLGISTLGKLRDVFSVSDLPFKVDVVDWASTRDEFKKIIQSDYLVIQEKPS